MSKCLNLIDDDELTRLLIAEPLEWRVRAVDELVIDSASGARHSRSLQVGSLAEIFAMHPGPPRISSDDESVLLALPLATIPRGPLLEFSVSGPYGQGWLLPRLEIAQREAWYLKSLVNDARETWHPDLDLLVPAILGFPGSVWLNAGVAVDLRDYLTDGLGRRPDAARVEEWREIGHQCREIRLFTDDGVAVDQDPVAG